MKNKSPRQVATGPRASGWKRVAKVIAGEAAKAVGRAVVRNVAQRATQKGNEIITSVVQTQTKRKPVTYNTKGTYVGPFKRAKRLSRKDDGYLRKGFVDTQEVTGTISDPDCVYVTHSVVDADYQIVLLLKVLMRKLFFKGIGWNCTRSSELIPDTGIVTLEYLNTDTGVVSQITKTFDTTLSLADVATHANFLLFCRQFSSGADGEDQINAWEWKYLRLSILDDHTTPTYRQVMELDIRNEKVKMFVRSKIKIQNRTKSATGSTGTDEVNNNPLIGYKYLCKNGCPEFRIKGAYLLETVRRDSGVNLVRAAELPVQFKEPPLPKIVLNCKKAAKIILQPGQIKDDMLYYEKTMGVAYFLKMLNRAYGAGTPLKSRWLIGKCTLFALEDVINVNLSENIAIAYEVNREIGMYAITRQRTVAIGDFGQSTLDNNPE